MKPREKAEMCARVREIRKMQHAVWRRTKMSYFSKKSNGCEYVNSVGTFFLHTCSRNTPIRPFGRASVRHAGRAHFAHVFENYAD